LKILPAEGVSPNLGRWIKDGRSRLEEGRERGESADRNSARRGRSSIDGGEELAGEREEGPRVQDSTWGKHREQGKTMMNSTLQSTVAKIEQRWLATSNGGAQSDGDAVKAKTERERGR